MKQKYYILNGVRRALAAREAGKKTILATLHEAGFSPSIHRVHLAQLYSPKATVEQDARFFRIQWPVEKPIDIECLGLRNQVPTTPLVRVKLL